MYPHQVRVLLLLLLLVLLLLLGGSIWSLTSAPNASSTEWKDIASDSTGSKLTAVTNQENNTAGGIYTSTSG